jgi:hypothetical protein
MIPFGFGMLAFLMHLAVGVVRDKIVYLLLYFF